MEKTSLPFVHGTICVFHEDVFLVDVSALFGEEVQA